MNSEILYEYFTDFYETDLNMFNCVSDLIEYCENIEADDAIIELLKIINTGE